MRTSRAHWPCLCALNNDFTLIEIHATLAGFDIGTKGIQPLLVDPTQMESKITSQIQWPVPSINAELVEVFLEGE